MQQGLRCDHRRQGQHKNHKRHGQDQVSTHTVDLACVVCPATAHPLKPRAHKSRRQTRAESRHLHAQAQDRICVRPCKCLCSLQLAKKHTPHLSYSHILQPGSGRKTGHCNPRSQASFWGKMEPAMGKVQSVKQEIPQNKTHTVPLATLKP